MFVRPARTHRSECGRRSLSLDDPNELDALGYRLGAVITRDAWSTWYRAHGRLADGRVTTSPYRDQPKSVVIRVFKEPRDPIVQTMLDELRIGVRVQHEHVWGAVEWPDDSLACRIIGAEGWTLLDIVRSGVIPDATAVQIARELCAASRFLESHELGPMYWVPTAERIIVGVDGMVRIEEPGSARLPTSERVVVQIGPRVETLALMSPERIKGMPINGVTVVREIGAALHALLTGSLAFDHAKVFGLLKAIISQPLPPLTDVQPALAAVVETACALDPEDRFESLDALAAALDRIAEDVGPPTKPIYELSKTPPRLAPWART